MKIVKNISDILLLVVLSFQWCNSQNNQAGYGTRDYSMWHTIEKERLSEDGNWVAFELRYNNGEDTLMVKNVKNNKTKLIPKGTNGQFAANSKALLYQAKFNQLKLLYLNDFSEQTFDAVKKFLLHPNASSVLVLSKENELQLISLEKKETIKFSNVKDFELGANGNLAIIKDTSVVITTTDNPLASTEITTNALGFKNPIWNLDKVAFFEELPQVEGEHQNRNIVFYDSDEKKVYRLETANFAELTELAIIKPFGQKGIFIETKEDKVFFHVKEKHKKEKEEPKLEIWEYNSPLEYPSQLIYDEITLKEKVAVWWPKKNTIQIIETFENPKAVVLPNSNYVLLSNPIKYEPQWDLAPPVDLCLMNLETKKTIILLEKQPQKVQTFGAAANGNYLHYYREKNWWVYNIEKNTHTNLTKELPFPVENFKQDEAGPKYGFGCVGWSDDNQYIFLYDEFDIWMISPDAKNRTRITKGRESNTIFRIEEEEYVNKSYRGKLELLTYTIDTKKGILIKAIDKNKNFGYYLWTNKRGLGKIHYEKTKISRMKLTTNYNNKIWLEEEATQPPKLVVKSANSKTPKTIHQTNAHFQKWGNRKTNLISYSIQNGSKLSGVLHYPVNHDTSKKYPMIVFIYEKLSQRKNQYEIPSYYNGAGFNVANYIYDGYFVLLPDIEYEIGNPGVSAKECVLNAVEQVLKEKTIDESRLGIIGHSFGGYQVASIITQTNKFKAAVAGAAVTDPVNLYVQMNWSWNRTQAWRFESQQMRMGTNPFENPQGYFANSPLYNAAKVNTPVLIWTGKEDYNVDWNQSIYFHMALRRLKKKNKLLLFPKEGHTIHNKENQITLTEAIKNWFEEHLK